jgi:hypothetical protein
MNHDPTCTGCPTCDPEMAAVLRMTPAQHAKWLQSKTRQAMEHLITTKVQSDHPPATKENPMSLIMKHAARAGRIGTAQSQVSSSVSTRGHAQRGAQPAART